MRLFLAVILAMIVGVFVVGSPHARSAAAPPPHIRPHAIQTAQDQQPAPSEQRIALAEAPEQPAPPGVLVVENNPQFPQDGPSGFQNNNKLHGFARPLSVPRPSHLHAHNAGISPNNVITSGPNVTGINHWWTYQGDSIGGVGRYMVNVAAGNLIAQADDMAIPHRGVELAFRRTYNSYSQHDYVLPSGTDGSGLNNYGDGWTNTFDAHVAFNDLTDTQCVPTGTGTSVYDIDGARYDYAFSYNATTHTCSYVPPPGQFATLTVSGDGSTYYWTKKSGTKYAFHSPVSTFPGNDGRLLRIWGRNQNASLAFSYCYDANMNTSDHLNAVLIKPETSSATSCTTVSDDALMLFSNFTVSGGTRRLLSTLIWPDGTQVTYNYDTSGRLIQANEPPNTSSGTKLHQWYSYHSGGHLLSQVNGGRWSASNGTDGGYLQLSYLGSSITTIQYYGYVNPTIPDNTSSGPLQSSFSGSLGVLPNPPYRTVTYAIGQSNPSPAPTSSPTGTAACTSTGSTPVYDSDGHEFVYCWDSTNRVVQADAFTGSQWLVSKQSWDSSNDLVSTTDARSSETDYAYDQNGNAIAVAEPAPSPSAPRPTAFYSYDSNNNVTAFCDPIAVHNAGKDWSATPAPNDALCSVSNGLSQFAFYTWVAPGGGYEPYGELTTVTTPLGYVATYSYDLAAQGGTDFGMPTKVLGTSFTQKDNTLIQPEQDLKYDSHGNLICYSKDGGSGWSILAYDTIGRLLQVGDPDDASITNSACPKTAGIAGSTIVTTDSYFTNGQLATSQNAAELAASVTSQFTYDADGNETSEIHHNGTTTPAPGVTPTTNKYYDGDDRLVEVVLPHDQTDYFTFNWITRYFYDLTQNPAVGTLSMQNGAGTFSAHGNLFKRQEYLPNLVANGQSQTPWIDTSGWAFDALDRGVTNFSYSPSQTLAAPSLSTSTYDAGAAGLLTSTTNAVGDTKSLVYDLIGRVTNINYTISSHSTDTPNETLTYDMDGRLHSNASTAFGTQYYTYDAMGHLISTTEPQGGSGTSDFPGSGGLTSPATITYDYYPNGWKEDLSVSSTALTQTQLFKYNYRADALLKSQIFNYGSAQTFGATYTTGGRMATTSDPTQAFARTHTYDTFGRVSSDTIASTRRYQAFSYDPEGEVTGLAGAIISPTPTPTPIADTHQYNNRGELIDAGQSANGYLYQSARYVTYGCGALPCSGTWTFDARSAAGLGRQAQTNATPTPPSCSIQFPFVSISGSVGYDASGRQSGSNETTTNDYPPCNPPGTPQPDSSSRSGTAYSYDANNHETVDDPYQTVNGNTFTRYAHIAWGPNGHPIADVSTVYTLSTPPPTFQAHTLHWDVDQLLFTTNSSGQLEDIKIGGLADFMPLESNSQVKLTVWDRDNGGRIAQAHNSTGYTNWTAPDQIFGPGRCIGTFGGFDNNTIGSYAPPSTFPQQDWWCDQSSWNFDSGMHGQIFQPSADNYTNEVDGFQGVRSTGGGGWLTPDPFGGVLDDPMSQKPYMYNRNNSMSYSDPTGMMVPARCYSCPSYTSTEGWIGDGQSREIWVESNQNLNNNYSQPDAASAAALSAPPHPVAPDTPCGPDDCSSSGGSNPMPPAQPQPAIDPGSLQKMSSVLEEAEVGTGGPLASSTTTLTKAEFAKVGSAFTEGPGARDLLSRAGKVIGRISGDEMQVVRWEVIKGPSHFFAGQLVGNLERFEMVNGVRTLVQNLHVLIQ